MTARSRQLTTGGKHGRVWRLALNAKMRRRLPVAIVAVPVALTIAASDGSQATARQEATAPLVVELPAPEPPRQPDTGLTLAQATTAGGAPGISVTVGEEASKQNTLFINHYPVGTLTEGIVTADHTVFNVVVTSYDAGLPSLSDPRFYVPTINTQNFTSFFVVARQGATFDYEVDADRSLVISVVVPLLSNGVSAGPLTELIPLGLENELENALYLGDPDVPIILIGGDNIRIDFQTLVVFDNHYSNLDHALDILSAPDGFVTTGGVLQGVVPGTLSQPYVLVSFSNSGGFIGSSVVRQSLAVNARPVLSMDNPDFEHLEIYELNYVINLGHIIRVNDDKPLNELTISISPAGKFVYQYFGDRINSGILILTAPEEPKRPNYENPADRLITITVFARDRQGAVGALAFTVSLENFPEPPIARTAWTDITVHRSNEVSIPMSPTLFEFDDTAAFAHYRACPNSADGVLWWMIRPADCQVEATGDNGIFMRSRSTSPLGRSSLIVRMRDTAGRETRIDVTLDVVPDNPPSLSILGGPVATITENVKFADTGLELIAVDHDPGEPLDPVLFINEGRRGGYREGNVYHIDPFTLRNGKLLLSLVQSLDISQHAVCPLAGCTLSVRQPFNAERQSQVIVTVTTQDGNHAPPVRATFEVTIAIANTLEVPQRLREAITISLMRDVKPFGNLGVHDAYEFDLESLPARRHIVSPPGSSIDIHGAIMGTVSLEYGVTATLTAGMEDNIGLATQSVALKFINVRAVGFRGRRNFQEGSYPERTSLNMRMDPSDLWPWATTIEISGDDRFGLASDGLQLVLQPDAEFDFETMPPIYTLTVTISRADDRSYTASRLLRMTMLNVYEPPQPTGLPLTMDVLAHNTLALTIPSSLFIVDASVDPQSMTFTALGAPAWLSVSDISLIGGTPDNDDVATMVYPLRFQDDQGGAATVDVTVTVREDHPPILEFTDFAVFIPEQAPDSSTPTYDMAYGHTLELAIDRFVDEDRGDVAPVLTLLSGGGLFEGVGGSVRLKPGISLDFETDPRSYTIEIVGQDGNAPTLRSEVATVTVHLRNLTEPPRSLLTRRWAFTFTRSVPTTFTLTNAYFHDAHVSTSFGIESHALPPGLTITGASITNTTSQGIPFSSTDVMFGAAGGPNTDYHPTMVVKSDGATLNLLMYITVVGNNPPMITVAGLGSGIEENEYDAVTPTGISFSIFEDDPGDSISEVATSDERFTMVGSSLHVAAGTSFDYEDPNDRAHVVTVSVWDSGNPRLSSEAVVTVSIYNNRFERHFTLHLGSLTIGVNNVLSMRLNMATLTFEFETGFGQIAINDQYEVGYEVRDIYSFGNPDVKLEITGRSPRHSTLYILVLNNSYWQNFNMLWPLEVIPDSPPDLMVTGETIYLEETDGNEPEFHTGFTVRATDPDIGEHLGPPRLTLSDDRLRIAANGAIMVRANADYDYENPLDRTVTVAITATDGNAPSIATYASITLEFANDLEVPRPAGAGISAAVPAELSITLDVGLLGRFIYDDASDPAMREARADTPAPPASLTLRADGWFDGKVTAATTVAFPVRVTDNIGLSPPLSVSLAAVDPLVIVGEAPPFAEGTKGFGTVGISLAPASLLNGFFGEAMTMWIVGDERFTVVGNLVRFMPDKSFDYEDPADRTLDFEVRLAPGSATANFVSRALRATVTNVHEEPVPVPMDLGLDVLAHNTMAVTIPAGLFYLDADADPDTYTPLGAPAWLTVAGVSVLRGTPTNADVGTFPFSLRLEDSQGNFGTVALTVRVREDRPPAFTPGGLTLDLPEQAPDSPTPTYVLADGHTLSLSIAVLDDPDADDVPPLLTVVYGGDMFEAVGTMMRLKPNISVDYETEPNTYTIAVAGLDGNAAALVGTATTITVVEENLTEPPRQLRGLETLTFARTVPRTVTLVDAYFHDALVSTSFAISASGLPTGLAFTGASITNTTAQGIPFASTDVFSGAATDPPASYPVVITVASDGAELRMSMTVVVAANNPPLVEVADASIGHAEGTFTQATPTGISFSYADPDPGDFVTTVTVGDPRFTVTGTELHFAAGAAFDYEMPDQRENVLTVVAADNGDPRLQTSVTVTVTITNVLETDTQLTVGPSVTVARNNLASFTVVVADFPLDAARSYKDYALPTNTDGRWQYEGEPTSLAIGMVESLRGLQLGQSTIQVLVRDNENDIAYDWQLPLHVVPDQPPTISVLGVQIPLTEQLFAILTPVGHTVTATDPDTGEDADPVLSVDDERFTIQADGRLAIQAGATIDYEVATDRQRTLEITAADGTSPEVRSTRTLVLDFGNEQERPQAIERPSTVVFPARLPLTVSAGYQAHFIFDHDSVEDEREVFPVGEMPADLTLRANGDLVGKAGFVPAATFRFMARDNIGTSTGTVSVSVATFEPATVLGVTRFDEGVKGDTTVGANVTFPAGIDSYFARGTTVWVEGDGRFTMAGKEMRFVAGSRFDFEESADRQISLALFIASRDAVDEPHRLELQLNTDNVAEVPQLSLGVTGHTVTVAAGIATRAIASPYRYFIFDQVSSTASQRGHTVFSGALPAGISITLSLEPPTGRLFGTTYVRDTVATAYIGAYDNIGVSSMSLELVVTVEDPVAIQGNPAEIGEDHAPGPVGDLSFVPSAGFGEEAPLVAVLGDDRFTLDSTGRRVVLAAGASLNYEYPADRVIALTLSVARADDPSERHLAGLTVSVTNVVEAPRATAVPPDPVVTENNTLSLALPPAIFEFDFTHVDPATVAVGFPAGQPAWLTALPGAAVTGTPPLGSAATTSVAITATDSNGAAGTAGMRITVVPDRAPNVVLTGLDEAGQLTMAESNGLQWLLPGLSVSVADHDPGDAAPLVTLVGDDRLVIDDVSTMVVFAPGGVDFDYETLADRTITLAVVATDANEDSLATTVSFTLLVTNEPEELVVEGSPVLTLSRRYPTLPTMFDVAGQVRLLLDAEVMLSTLFYQAGPGMPVGVPLGRDGTVTLAENTTADEGTYATSLEVVHAHVGASMSITVAVPMTVHVIDDILPTLDIRGMQVLLQENIVYETRSGISVGLFDVEDGDLASHISATEPFDSFVLSSVTTGYRGILVSKTFDYETKHLYTMELAGQEQSNLRRIVRATVVFSIDNVREGPVARQDPITAYLAPETTFAFDIQTWEGSFARFNVDHRDDPLFVFDAEDRSRTYSIAVWDSVNLQNMPYSVGITPDGVVHGTLGAYEGDDLNDNALIGLRVHVTTDLGEAFTDSLFLNPRDSEQKLIVDPVLGTVVVSSVVIDEGSYPRGGDSGTDYWALLVDTQLSQTLDYTGSARHVWMLSADEDQQQQVFDYIYSATEGWPTVRNVDPTLDLADGQILITPGAMIENPRPGSEDLLIPIRSFALSPDFPGGGFANASDYFNVRDLLATLTIRNLDPNPPFPIAMHNSVAVRANELLSYQPVSAQFRFDDSHVHPASYRVEPFDINQPAPAWLSVNAVGDSFVLQGRPRSPGLNSLIVFVTDSNDREGGSRWLISVGVDHAPTVSVLAGTVTMGETVFAGLTTISLSLVAGDPDPNDATVSLEFINDPQQRFTVVGRDAGSIHHVLAQGTLDYETAADRTVTLQLAVRDGNGPSLALTLPFAVFLENVYEDPVVDNGYAGLRVTRGVAVSVAVPDDAFLFDSSSTPATRTFGASGMPAGLSVDVAGDVVGRPTAAVATYVASVSVVEPGMVGAAPVTPFTVEVLANNPPQVSIDGSLAVVPEGEHPTGATTSLVYGATDADLFDAVASIWLVGDSRFGIDPASQRIIVVPQATFDHDDPAQRVFTVSVMAADTAVPQLTGHMAATISVANVIEAPGLGTPPPVRTIGNNNLLSVTIETGWFSFDVTREFGTIGLAGYASDLPAAELSLAVTGTTPPLFLMTSGVTGEVTAIFHMAEARVGTDTVTLGTQGLSVKVVVVPDQAPTIGVLGTQAALAEGTASADMSTGLTLEVGDPDVGETSPVSVSLADARFLRDPASGALVRVAGAVFDHEDPADRTVAFAAVAIDGNANDPSLASTVMVSITIANVHERPVANGGAVTQRFIQVFPASVSVGLDALFDYDDGSQEDEHAFGISAGAMPAGLVLAGSGLVTGTPTAATGTTTLSILAIDATTLTSTAAAEFVVVVSEAGRITGSPATIGEGVLASTALGISIILDELWPDERVVTVTGDDRFGLDGPQGKVIVTTGATLDFEDPADRSITLLVAAHDAADPALGISATVEVHVTNMVEFPVANGPSLPLTVLAHATLSVSLPDDLFTYDATHTDGGQDYVIGIGSPAWAQEDDAVMVLTPRQVHVGTSTVALTVLDSGFRPGDTAFTIDVLPDRAPVLVVNPTAVTVTENMAGVATDLVATATDPDTIIVHDEPAAVLSLAGDGRFELRGTTLWVKESVTIDFEDPAGPAITLEIHALDGNAPTIATMVAVTVHVANANDLPPMLQVTGTQATLDENIGLVSTGLTVVLSDEDGTVPVLAGTPAPVSFAGSATDTMRALVFDPPLTVDFETMPDLVVTLTASDGVNATDMHTLTVTFSNVNEAPTVAAGLPDHLDHQASVLFRQTLAGAFGDPEDDPLTYAVSSEPDATLSVAAGAVEGTPLVVGGYSVTVTASDPEGLAATTSFVLSVVPNEPPVLVATGSQAMTLFEGLLTVREFTGQGYMVTDKEDDRNGRAVAVTLTGDSRFGVDVAAMSLWVAAGATFDYEDVADRMHTLTLVATDHDGATDSLAVTVSVANQDENPTWLGSSPALSVLAHNTLTTTVATSMFSYDSSHVDGTEVFSFGSEEPGWAVLAGSVATFTPTQEAAGTVTVQLTVSDKNSMEAFAPLTITVLPDRPPLLAVNVSQVMHDENSDGVTIGIRFMQPMDPDAGDVEPTYRLQGDGRFTLDGLDLSIRAGAAIDHEVAADRAFALEFVAQDGNAGEVIADTLTVSVFVNNLNDSPPTLTVLGTQHVLEENQSHDEVGLTVSVGDPDGGALPGLTLVDDSGRLELLGSFVSSLRVLRFSPSYTPNFEVASILVVSVVADDGGNRADSTVTVPLTISFTDANDPPVVAQPLADHLIQQVDKPFVSILLDTFTDEDGDTLTLEFNTDPAVTWLELLSTFTLTATTTPELGEFTIMVTASDGRPGGTVSDAFRLRVLTNSAPSLDLLGSQTLILTEGLVVDGADTGQGYRVSDTEDDRNSVAVAVVLDGDDRFTLDLARQTVMVSAGATFDFENPADRVITLSLIATDSDQASVARILSVVVSDANEQPTLVTTIPDGTATVNVPYVKEVATYFGDQDAGTTLTYGAAAVAGTGLGWLQVDSSAGRLSGTPDVAGTTTVSVSASDGTLSQHDTFELVVLANSPPVLDVPGSQAIELLDGVAVTVVTPSGFTVSLTDANPTDELSLGVTPPGAFTISANLLLVKAGVMVDHEVATVLVGTVAASDGLHTVAEEVTLTVTPRNDMPPVLSVSGSQVLLAEGGYAADTGTGHTIHVSDADRDSLLPQASVSDGRFTLAGADRTTPRALLLEAGTQLDFETEAEIVITLTATDGPNEDTATLTLTVTDRNDPPVVVTASVVNQTGTVSIAFNLGLAPMFADEDAGANLTYAVSGASWLAVDEQFAELAGVPDLAGPYTVLVTATDNSLAAVTAQFTVLVLPNQPPSVTFIGAQTLAILDGTPIPALAGTGWTVSLADPDGDDNQISVSLSPAGFTLGADGRLLLSSATGFDHEAGAVLTVSLVATDQAAFASTWTLHLMVTDLDDVAPEASAATTLSVALSENVGFADGDPTGLTVRLADIDTALVSLRTTVSDSSPTTAFRLESSGALRALVFDGAHTLNYEEEAAITVTVVATDRGVPVPQSDTLTLFVGVGDRNDPPVLEDGIMDMAVKLGDTLMLTVTNFSDEDGGQTLSYAITNDPVASWLTIDNDVISGSTDTETTVSVMVTATDDGLDPPTLSATDSFVVRFLANNVPVIATTGFQTVSIIDSGPPFAADTPSGIEVTATDADDGETPVLSVLPDERFVLADGTLLVRAGVAEDYEVVTAIVATVEATDGRDPATMEITLTVTPRNDVPPVLERTGTQVVLNEGNFDSATDTGHTFAFSDGDRDSPLPTGAVSGDDRFELSGGDRTSPRDLRIKAGRTFDHETGEFITVTVTAADGANADDTNTVTITIADVNEAPTVSSPVAAQTATVSIAFGYMLATHFGDEDEGTALTYAITGPSWLVVDSASGALSGTPDAAGTRTVTATAGDGHATTPLSATLTFALEVLANQPPMVTRTGSQTLAVLDETPITPADGTGYTFTFEDPDGDDAKVTVSITPAGFTLAGNGALLLSSEAGFDYEEAAMITVSLTFTDEEGFTTTRTADISVTELDDEKPVLSPVAASFTVALPENDPHADGDPTGLTVALADLDTPASLLLVELSDSSTLADFRLQGNAARRAVLFDGAHTFNYEVEETITITATVRDLGAQTDTLTLYIDVVDVNDRPRRTSPMPDDTVELRDTHVRTVTNFTDEDAGQVLAYTIMTSPSVSWLTISGTVISGMAPAEAIITVTVTATDDGVGPLSATDSYVVRFVANNRPVISTLGSQAIVLRDGETLAQNARSGITIVVTDADPGDTVSTLVRPAGQFGLGPDGRLVVVAGVSVDYEQATVLVATVVADDSKDQSTLLVALSVTEVDDNVPAITRVDAHALVSIDEGTYTVATATSLTFAFSDADRDSPTPSAVVSDSRFTLSGANPSTPRDLLVRADTTFDHETQPTLTVTVTATDGSAPDTTATVTILVNDVNEAPSVLMTVGNQTATVSIGFTYALEPHFADEDVGDVLTYAVTNPSWLAVDPASGVLAGVPVAAGTQTATASASDGTLAVTVVFNLAVLDNMPPILSCPGPQTLTVREEEPITTPTDTGYTCTYRDPDGDDSLLAVTVTPAWFTLAANGNLQVSNSAGFDHEVTPALTAMVAVTDEAGLSTTRTVVITVTGRDDETPSLTANPASVALREIEPRAAGSPTGLTVTLADADTALASLLLTVTDSSAAASFRLDGAGATRALVFAAAHTLDFEREAAITITVVVADQGSPPQAATLSLTLGVLDENDPVTTTVTLPDRTLKVGRRLSVDLAGVFTDADGESPVIGVTMTPAPAWLTLAGMALAGTAPAAATQTVVVSATDGGGAVARTTFNVTVTNNAAPVLTVTGLPATVAEGTYTLRTPTGVGYQVSDADNASVTVQALPAATFTATAGMLHLQAGTSIDYEARHEIPVTLVAGDGEGGTMAMALTLAVGNLDDEPTELECVGTQVSLVEGTVAVDTYTGYSCRVADPDGNLPTVSVSDGRFTLVEVTTNGKEATLDLKVRGSVTLDYEDGPVISLTVSAADPPNGPRTEVVELTLTDFDEPPQLLRVVPVQTILVTMSLTLDLNEFVIDPEGETLTFELSTEPAVDWLRLVEGTLTGTPPAPAELEVQVTITDASGKSIVISFDVIVLDRDIAAELGRVHAGLLPEIGMAMANDLGLLVETRRSRGLDPSATAALVRMLRARARELERGELSLRDFLANQDLAVAVDGTTFWAAAAGKRLERKGGDLEWNGNLHTGNVGIDWRVTGDMLLGLGLSRAWGRFDYVDNLSSGSQRGELALDSDTAFVYFVGTPTAGVETWGYTGLGRGEVEVRDRNAEFADQRSPLGVWLYEFGFAAQLDDDGRVRVRGVTGGSDLDVDEAGLVPAQHLQSRHAALGLEFDGAPIAGMRPNAHFGIRRDAASGRPQWGLEAGLGLRDSSQEPGDIYKRFALRYFRRNDGAAQWGAVGALGRDPRLGPLGLSWQLDADFGIGVGQDRSARLESLGMHGGSPAADGAGLRLGVGYGMPLGVGTFTPRAAYHLRSGDYDTGLRYAQGRSLLLGVKMEGGDASTGYGLEAKFDLAVRRVGR